ncbi:MAG: PilC/PilY family type IV pilus protein [Steroidobacteraceae bacterium]|jgi:type IV pilus assembly protein PilY1|nr:PilC/PilY family type IV pilus protein [Steroidobacteraceae bacterium]
MSRASLHRRLLALACGAFATLAGVAPALADETEVFLNQVDARGVRPNILFIVDTSGSMNSLVQVPKAPYDPTVRYDGGCVDGRLYYQRASDGAIPPPCAAAASVALAQNRCAAVEAALRGRSGFWTGRIAQWDEARVGWRGLRNGEEQPLECQADAGVHGADADSPRRWARNGDVRNRWTGDAAGALSWGGADVYTLYGANYLNWYHAAPVAAEISRLDVVKSVGAAIAYSVDNVNLGLMRFSAGARTDDFSEGGMVTHEVAALPGARASIVERLFDYTADGFTPLSETLYEAGQYLAGREVDYGLGSTIEDAVPFPSVPESRRADDPSRYRSPAEFQCQRNFVVLLTDGEPTSDSSADEKIAALPGFGRLGRASCDGEGEGRCLDDMAQYLNEAVDLAPAVPGRQNAITYTIGFGPEVAGSSFLEAVATRGGGRAFAANDVAQLSAALQTIFGDIQQSGSTFVAPSVSVNAFNRTQANNELYVSVFKPDDTLRWPGNVKKYGIRDGQIVDATGAEVVDPATGFLRDGTRSLWSETREQDAVESGGAASRLPEPPRRRLFTHIPAAGIADLTAAANAFATSNTTGLTDAVLNTGGTGPTREQVIEWARGIDRSDADGDGDRDETLRRLGDPLHARPAIVSYGGSTARPDAADAVVYVPTNDGFVHAFDARSGEELWAFIPPELLGRLADLYRNPSVARRSYGLDSDVRVLKFDVDQDGVVDAAAGDRVWLFFGMRRGGRHLYALDVTDRERPRLKWNLGPAQLPGVGQTWSTPTIARMRIEGAQQNGENLVLVFGGGYDEAQDDYGFTTDTSGNRIFVVDAASGQLLWYAGGPGAEGTPDLALPRMTHSIPGRIVALDVTGDQFADRLYAADMGGRVWRFDLWNGRPRARFGTGGVLATLGAGDTGATSIEDNRRFYSAPDVALIQRRAADPYFNLAIGSGYRGHPLHTETRDRFYSIRDRNPFGAFTQEQYDASTPLTDSRLVDITDDPVTTPVPTNAPGWKLELRLNGGWSGEKVLAEATTVGGTILFTTYQPQSRADVDPCQPAIGVNRAYALGVDSGRPVIDYNEDEALDASDLSTRLAQSGIAGEVSIALESVRTPGSEPGGDAQAGLDPLGRRGFCVVGVEVLRRCVIPGAVVRTWWQRVADDGSAP